MEKKIYYMLDDKELEIIKKASNITCTDYELIGNEFPMNSFISLVEDLMYELEIEKEKYEDLERDLQDNYQPLPRSSYTGNSDDDRY